MPVSFAHGPDAAPLARLPGLGPASIAMLAAIGVRDRSSLEALGAVDAFRRIRDDTDHRPS